MNRLELVSGSNRVPSVLLAASARQTGAFSRHVYLEELIKAHARDSLFKVHHDVGAAITQTNGALRIRLAGQPLDAEPALGGECQS